MQAPLFENLQIFQERGAEVRSTRRGELNKAKYHHDIDAIVVQFVNTSGGDMWTLSEIVFDRIVRIVRRKK